MVTPVWSLLCHFIPGHNVEKSLPYVKIFLCPSLYLFYKRARKRNQARCSPVSITRGIAKDNKVHIQNEILFNHGEKNKTMKFVGLVNLKWIICSNITQIQGEKKSCSFYVVLGLKMLWFEWDLPHRLMYFHAYFPVQWFSTFLMTLWCSFSCCGEF